MNENSNVFADELVQQAQEIIEKFEIHPVIIEDMDGEEELIWVKFFNN